MIHLHWCPALLSSMLARCFFFFLLVVDFKTQIHSCFTPFSENVGLDDEEGFMLGCSSTSKKINPITPLDVTVGQVLYISCSHITFSAAASSQSR